MVTHIMDDLNEHPDISSVLTKHGVTIQLLKYVIKAKTEGAPLVK